MTGLHAAEATNTKAPPGKKSPEASFMEGQACLQRTDLDCARLALNRIPAPSAYAKLLQGNIAAAQGDFDQTFRLLLPLQADQTLSKPATASLHASLGLAYENQPDTLRALEQYVETADYLGDAAARAENDQRIWHLLSQPSRSELIDIRGESYDSTIQGWIDLALAAQSLDSDPTAIRGWRAAYPDHVARAFAKRQFGEGSTESASSIGTGAKPASLTQPPSAPPTKLQGPVAVLLPFGVGAFYPVSDAIERGFVTAQGLHQDSNDIRLYPTDGSKEAIEAVYAQAIGEGAAYVLGPLTRDEATALASQDRPVPTLELNQPETAATGRNVFSFGLSIESEVSQIVRLARNAGMQTATIVSSGSPVAGRAANAFRDAWLADGGEILLQTGPDQTTTLGDMHERIKAQPTDMIFFAASPEEARAIRPFLDSGTPTFGISHLYSGLPFDPSDHVMNAVRFVELPWVLDSDNADFKAYRDAAAELPPGEMQRWFALGADAYALLLQLSVSPLQATTIDGLTGKLRISATGKISRELALGRFSADGVVLEKAP
ncbi:MAG TPA: penicillin-binding protein activator [Methylophilaceae bacterium]|nr:penicillin-binding protein activator [Methylophilaceae bacterium]